MKHITEILNLDIEGMKEQCRNPGANTFNGTKFVNLMTNGVISEAEAAWTWKRVVDLRAAGMEKEAALAQIKTEAKAQPWLQS